MAPLTGARIIALSLRNLGVTTIFGIVGIPVVEIAEEAINLGIRFIGFRNEQSAGYAATAYGYLTGKPGVCLVVGGPGVLHAIAGVGNSHANAWPLLLLAGSSETHLVSKGAFQELDAISLLTPHTKLALRPPWLNLIPNAIQNTYKTAWYGKPGTGFVDLPADLIKDSLDETDQIATLPPLPEPPKCAASTAFKAAQLIKNAKAPLVVIGKGAAYARAEVVIREFIQRTRIPFLPTPMGKGVVSDAHPLNGASARSTALKGADVVLVLGARLNWILHFGEAPKWNPKAQFIQVDISPGEIGKNDGNAELGIVGDISTVVPQLMHEVGDWAYNDSVSTFIQHLAAAKEKNEANAVAKATSTKSPMTFANAFSVIERTLHRLSPPDEGGIVYVSEGANTMDISRSIFPVSHPRLRLDAGTYATMGVGLGYAIAAHAAYNGSAGEGSSGPAQRKKIVCLEGDSAFGFSAMEVETMARYGMDVLIFVMNNGGVYHGDSDSTEEWSDLQKKTLAGDSGSGLRSTSLGWEVRYEKLAEACGGTGYFVRTPEELEEATQKGYQDPRVTIVNVVVESGKGQSLEFGWQASEKTKKDTCSQSSSKKTNFPSTYFNLIDVPLSRPSPTRTRGSSCSDPGHPASQTLATDASKSVASQPTNRREK
ncbi:uncharacterized protein KY384_004065 [Bacidia gigantensis]|uniref:uncharacterized protein n=1 Tax=Bacidia gigantensis TaxID=2732470 RepID=UPI001D04BF53|nr:uncharacterized protein KY384_004065 [Bacidia gigantensis]KAG8530709.1 hypothetical protein KY384_004065 [Bacidia gigantensis]